MCTPDVKRHHVVHMTSVHARSDVRIYQKQCRSLAKAGFLVSLVVADGRGDEVDLDGIRIYDVGKMNGRVKRILFGTQKVLARAEALDGDLYQVHDPELLAAGARLTRKGKAVIFDSHEDVPKQILGKPYLNMILRRIVSRLYALYESKVVRRLSAVIAATPMIEAKFSRLAHRTINVNNYPKLGELANEIPWTNKKDEVCYVGGISETRGIIELIDALEKTSSIIHLNLVGQFSEYETERKARTRPGWRRVLATGFQDRDGVRDIMARSLAGIVTFAPLPNHVDAQPNKLFEYMSAGIPVIASDFPLWREIIAGSNCGLCVDPRNASDIAAALDWLVSNPATAERMGQNGKSAVESIYNWKNEEKKLVALYRELLK